MYNKTIMPLRNFLREHDHYEVAPVNGPNRAHLERDQEAARQGTREVALSREAMARLNRILTKLEEKSSPEIETKIDVLRPYRPHTWPFVRSHLWSWWSPPARGVSISSYAYGNPAADREVHYEAVEEGVVAWAIPFALGGRKPTPTKDIDHRHKPYTLIIEKSPKNGQRRSWLGGYEAFSDGPATILKVPDRMAVGEGLTSGAQGGFFGDNAIGGIGRLNNPRFNNSMQIDKVWNIGNAVINFGEAVNLTEEVPDQDLVQNIRDANFYR